MTDSIYDVELYSTSFLFTYEDYLSVKSHAELPIKCSHCGKTFYRKKKQITRDIKLHKTSFYCCRECQSKGHQKQREERTYTCKFCGKVFTELPSKYSSGDFCSKDCARKYSSQFANTDEKRKQKSDVICDMLGIPHKDALRPRPSERKKVSYIQRPKTLAKQRREINTKRKNVTHNQRPKTPTKKNRENNKIFYDQIMELYEDYNFTDIQKKLNISYGKFKRLKKIYGLKENPKFVSTSKVKVISFCKRVLQKETSITIDDYNTVKEILINHLYKDNMSPSDIKDFYKIEHTGFGMFLKVCFGIKPRSLSEAIKNYHTNIGTYDNKDEKELYYLKCDFRFGLDDLKRVEGFDLIQKYGMYSVPDNLDGVARDHMVSRYYGWTHNIPPEVIRHPANCRIIKQRENSSKGKDCSITIEELYERIKNW